MRRSVRRVGWALAGTAWMTSLAVSCGRSVSEAPPDVALAGGGTGPAADAGAGAESNVGGAPLTGAGGATAGTVTFPEGGDAPTEGAPIGVGGAPTDCTANGAFCDGPSVRICAADGQGSSILSTCQASEVCKDGACKPIVCVPSALACFENAVQLCSEDGTSRRVIQRCGSGRYCSATSDGAECLDTWCAPGSALCAGDRATRCNAEGSAPVAGGEDCKSQGQLCVDGVCKAQKCEPGKKLCQSGDAYFCVNGADTLLLDDCDANEACDPELAVCEARICEPGSASCDGNRSVTCNALGTAYLSGTDCGVQVCVAGSCLPKVCEPNSLLCSGSNEVRRCNELGTGTSLSQSCFPGYSHCVVSGSYAYCGSNTCTPNLPACANNSVVMCNSVGDGFTSDPPQPCGSSALCIVDACQPKVCNNNERYCKDGSIYQCQNGLAGYIQQNCAPDAMCKAAGGSASCVAFECSPGFKTCLKDQLGTCAADGFSLVAVTQDCAGQGQVCTSAGGCAAQAVDTLGNSEELESFANGQLFGDVVDVLSNRVLTRLEANLVLAGTRDLRWSLFEANGSYFEARYDKVVRQEAGSGFVASGDLDYPLKAGRRYLFAVSVSLGGVVANYDVAPFSNQPSFGRTVGSISGTYSSNIFGPNPSLNRSYALRVTSSPP